MLHAGLLQCTHSLVISVWGLGSRCHIPADVHSEAVPVWDVSHGLGALKHEVVSLVAAEPASTRSV